MRRVMSEPREFSEQTVGRQVIFEQMLHVGAAERGRRNWHNGVAKCLQETEPCPHLIESLRHTTKEAPELLLARMDDGNTWLHTDMEDDFCVALIEGAKASRRPEVTERVMHVTNNNGLTPMQSAVVRGDCRRILTLYANSDQNTIDDTHLRLAIENKRANVVKALICLGGNYDTLMTWNNPAPDIRALCERINKAHTVAEMPSVGVDGIAQANQERLVGEHLGASKSIFSRGVKRRGHHCLSLDGGGIRGLVTIQILLAIQMAIGDRADLANHFDYFAGTSTGAIMALALANGKTLDYCRKLYLKLKSNVFKPAILLPNRPYDPKPLEDALKETFGRNTTIDDMRRNGKRVFITTVRADLQPPKLIRVCSWRPPRADPVDDGDEIYAPLDWPIWKAARCSSAAPTYFSSVDGRYADGGLLANNPSGLLIREVYFHDEKSRQTNAVLRTLDGGCVLSVGTGRTESRTTFIAEFSGNLIDKARAPVYLMNLLLELVSPSDGHVVDHARALSHAYGAPFYRLQPYLDAPVDLAETNDERIVDMLWETEMYIISERRNIVEIAKLLRRPQ